MGDDRHSVEVLNAIDPGSIRIAALTREHAEDISTWRYGAPYGVDDMVGTGLAFGRAFEVLVRTETTEEGSSRRSSDRATQEILGSKIS